MDASGNFWLFGGWAFEPPGTTKYFNDLWKFDPVTNQWTWMKGDSVINQLGIYGSIGVPASTNKPGSRNDATSWTDGAGNFWLFGGFGYSASSNGRLNDLWKYNPVNNEWVWVMVG